MGCGGHENCFIPTALCLTFRLTEKKLQCSQLLGRLDEIFYGSEIVKSWYAKEKALMSLKWEVRWYKRKKLFLVLYKCSKIRTKRCAFETEIYVCKSVIAGALTSIISAEDLAAVRNTVARCLQYWGEVSSTRELTLSYMARWSN